jgi:myeloid leukemia factor 1
VYTHSTIINYDSTGTAPRYQEQISEVRKAGAAKEVRRTVRDSATGEERMEIGHHLGDRAHIIEKKRVRGGRIEEEQKFVNLKEG